MTPQTQTIHKPAYIDALDDHDKAPQSTFSTWMLGLLFVLVISWLPAASETTPMPTASQPVAERPCPLPMTDISVGMTP